MGNCTASCLATAPTFTFAGCSLQDAIRSGYIKNFIATRCDITITDITDDTEIASYYTASKMFTSPTLTGELPFPSLSDPITENCQPEVNTKRTYNFNFTSYRVDNTSQTDFAQWDAFDNKLDTWYIAPVTCDNIILVPQEFTTGSNLGFEMRGTISAVIPNGNAMYYEGQLTFNYNGIVKGIALAADVITEMGL